MKYPFILFYRSDNYSIIDTFFYSNCEKLNCTVFIINNINDINKLFNSNYNLLITYGNSFDEYKDSVLEIISENMLIRHKHINCDQPIDINKFNNEINTLYVNICSLDRVYTRPIFSIFTTSFNSFDKILRAYNSIKTQIFKDWEWIIVDDSNSDDNFNFLRKQFSNDSRVRFFRKSYNNGSIGNVKNEAISLCRGQYVLEMDHDDEICDWLLQDAVKLFNSDNELGFIYADFSIMYENGNNHHYGDLICKGYGSYYSQKYNNKWIFVYITPNINNITLSHLVCCPNHPRIWRKEFLLKIGSYSEYLPICDDYEVILRTCISTKVAKIHKLGYIQYMNNENNNFSLIRNSEINRIGPQYISPYYYNKFNINNKMKELNAYEDEKYIVNHSNIYERNNEEYNHNFCNKIVNYDYDKQYCLIGIDSLIYNMDTIKELYQNCRNDFLVLENKNTLQYLQEKLDYYGFSRMKCYSIIGADKQMLINYFNLLYKSISNYEIIDINIKFLESNCNYNNRSELLNNLTKKTDLYLEIGIENGHTFNNTHFLNKIGLDPNPKSKQNLDKILKCTSNEYFQKNEQMFDVIFIDGMHQIEYLLDDINNSIKFLNYDGQIFIDNITPFNYDEQLKIPKKHYYENNILMYGEPWTGDVWKLIYFILQKYNKKLSFNYYSNMNYRGVGLFQIKEKFEIDKESIELINNFDYFKDYNNYLNLLYISSSQV
jgi:O-antigen biosynthesis protein